MLQRHTVAYNSVQRRTTTNFEQTFTPRTWPRSTSNFGKTRFRRFATFDFLTPKNFFSENLSQLFFVFSQFLADFGGARLVLMSKSDSWRYFASDCQIFRSVGRLELILKTMADSKPATRERARAMGKGREGVNPSPGTGDWRFGQFLYTLVGPEGLGGFLSVLPVRLRAPV